MAGYRGFNLQYKWHRNLVLNSPPVGKHYEQFIGRTHRRGQKESTVYVTMLHAVEEQREGFRQARADALYNQQTTGQPQKLCFADYV